MLVKRKNFSSILFRTLFALILSIHTVSPSQPITAPIAPHFQKGMCYVTWEKDKFASQLSDQSLNMLKKMGVEFVQINVTKYQDTYNSTKIKDTERTPSDKSIKHVIKKSHKLGLDVMLKPQIDLIDDNGGAFCRGDIGFQSDSNWEKWFDEYERFIIHYAKIAEKLKVKIFCVGTELSFSTEKTAKWKQVIKKVRAIYKGTIVYAANWDNYKNIEFWDDMDYMGIDAYFPLSYSQSPSLEELKKGWERWGAEIEQFAGKHSKKVIFTELGYSSTSTAASQPWKNASYGNANVDIQYKCYKAFFDTVWNKDWLSGVYWWRWAPTIYGGGNNNRRFTPMNKPAGEILTQYYCSFKFSGPINDEILTKNELSYDQSVKHANRKTYGLYKGTKDMARPDE